MRRRIPFLLAVALLIVAAPPLVGTRASDADPDPLHALEETMSILAADSKLVLFKAGVFDPALGVPAESAFGRSDIRDRSEGTLHFVVQFPCVPGESERKLLDEAGAEILYYLPNNAYLVRADSSRVASLETERAVRSIFRLPKFAKVDPALISGPGPDPTVELVCTPGASGTPVAGRLAKDFPSVRFITSEYHHKGGRVVCAVSDKDLTAFLDEASGLEDVLSILPWQEKVLLNDNSIWVGQGYDTSGHTTPIWAHGITGTGQITCVNDSGCDTDMCFFRYDATAGSKTTSQSPTPPSTGTIEPTKKIIAYYVEPGAIDYDYSGSSFHGTHTCGSVLGDNFATLSTPSSGGHDSGDGMAPNAKLVMQDVGGASGLSGLQGDLNDMFLQAYSAGARIHSDSWGTESSNYDSTAMDMDEFTYRYEDFLFVIAMGNSGTAPGDGSIGSPATAKSVVSVGATTNGSSSNANNLMDYSRGPVDDGRRKPDVCSPGDYINSASGTTSNTDNNCSPKTLSGTSMATPTTAGFLTLMRQYFTDGWYPTGTKTAADARNPSAALMKACIINGAMEMTGTDLVNSSTITRIPSMDQGWGRSHLENALFFSGDPRRTRIWDIRNANGLTTGQQSEYTVNVTANTQPLKVHLVWSDPESTTLAATNLVNNLDLEVVNPGGTVYRGNVFATGQSTTGGTADVLNTVEGFVLNSPATGNWTLRVKATSVPGAGSAPYSNRQGYALVATWATCTSTLAAPTGLSATDNGTTGVDLSWNTVSGATGYVVYKAIGSSPVAGDYTVLVQQAGTTFTDTKVQGGYTYWYKVRATDNCSESPLSSATSATYSGNCALFPTFSGLSTVTNDMGTVVCDLLLSWSAAASNCPLGSGVSYNIYRATTPYFTPGAGNMIANGVAGTSYRDYSVVGYTTYYYVVRAEDTTTLNGGPNNGGNQDTNTVMVMGTPWASTTAAGTFTDDGGDTNAKLALDAPWRVTNLQNHTSGGTFCYHNAQDGLTYPAGVCVAATTPPLPLQAGAQLSYWVRFDIEYQWDGVVTEISTNGGSSWTALTPTPAYPSTLSQTQGNACNYTSTQACFTGPSTNGSLTAWTQYSHDLSSYAGQTVLVRWNFTADGGAEFEGFYLDDIQVTNALVNEGCATRDGIVALDATSYTCSGDTIGIQLADYDLRNAGTYPVTIASTTEPAGETLTLTESPAGSGAFGGSITTTAAAPPSPGLLSVTNGDTITVTYIDADDGHGGTNVTKTDTATADCVLPVISNVLSINITYNSADITWDTNESADSYVAYDTVTPPAAWSASDAAMVTSHSLHLTGLSPCTTYFFYVRSDDPATNRATDTNGGSYYTFDTPQLSQPTYVSTDVPKTISDNVTMESNIVVPDSKVVQDVNVTITSLTHTYDGDMDISLVAPDNTVILLSNNRGGSGDNFTNTVFDDEAATAIASGAAPFTGSFIPDAPLSGFDGKNSAGTWKLRILDSGAGDTGTLTGWSLTITYPPQACGPHGKYASIANVADTCSSGGAGNANGVWDAGETVQFSVTLENDGTTTLTGVSATVSSATPGVTFPDATAAYADIAVGATGTSQAPHFTAQLPTGLACGSSVSFHVVITTAQGTWSGDFTHGVGQDVPGNGTAFSDDFEDAGTWGNWTVTTGPGPHTCGPFARVNTASQRPAGGSGYYALSDSDACGSGTTTSTILTSPIIDCSNAAWTAVTLDYDIYYNYYNGDDATVQVYDGSGWVTVWTDGNADINTHHTWDVSAQALGNADFRVRFSYQNASYDYWYAVDNVQVTYAAPAGCTMTACTPSAVPKPVPDGQWVSGTAMKGTLVSGNTVHVTWDVSTCVSGGYNLYSGPLSAVSSYGYDTWTCGIGTSGGADAAISSTGTAQFFVVVPVQGTAEGSHGMNGTGTERSASGVGHCSVASKDTSGTCP